ncbi:protein LplC [Paenibacillus faecis]|uniref:Carbohydrate ABC transporter permease n=1 Tax=Paenibacillus faecis TaxID=862114 RepID=A0A5D0CKM6_9BACL|nr:MULTISPECIES: carbohydrate ABC transporter permease [Paenibacillus]MCA1295362.1 carbohydrate ABC transporter permease [Paenibacillus sp. alder61]TYA10242.1 carbohydrate ABC transporter permease [Paenibacillus faecis]GIO84788.1 protein LplC [Paenibacillus faecis]
MVTSRSDKWFNAVIYVILVLIAVAAVFPLLYVISMSLTPYSEVVKNGGFIVLPRKISFEAYERIFADPALGRSMLVTVIVTVGGTLVNMIFTTLAAYPLSRRNLPGRTFFLLYMVFTMLFSGGLIPTYLVIQSLGMINTLWALIIPGAIATFNVLILKSFFETLPEELFESARIDGAREFRILWQVAIPLSLPSMMTVGLFYMVGHWNSFFSAVLYITDTDLNPLQVVIRNMLLLTQSSELQAEITVPTAAMQMAAVIAGSLPIIAVYPFIQKHFTKGMLLGAVKG